MHIKIQLKTPESC